MIRVYNFHAITDYPETVMIPLLFTSFVGHRGLIFKPFHPRKSDSKSENGYDACKKCKKKCDK